MGSLADIGFDDPGDEQGTRWLLGVVCVRKQTGYARTLCIGLGSCHIVVVTVY